MSNYSEGNGFEDILERLLANIDDSLDKRQGSIIYDALAPAAAELAQCYIALDVYDDQTYLINAVGENLDKKVADYGIIRRAATPSIRLANIYNENEELMEIELGTRFSIPNEYGGYNFTVIDEIDIGVYLLECETLGTAGNEYIGDLIPLETVNELGKAEIIDIKVPGEDEEDDEELRRRTLDRINQKSFSGNMASYKEYVDNINGVGLAKIYPTWNGGGTVKVVFTTSDYNIPSSDFVNTVQEQIDPLANQGQGLGMAPIGHTVTVLAPNKLDINISANIYPESGYLIGQLKPLIEKALKDYIKQIQVEWENSNRLFIFIAKVIASILSVNGVSNVTEVKINNQTTDLEIVVDAENTQFPILGEVILSDN